VGIVVGLGLVALLLPRSLRWLCRGTFSQFRFALLFDGPCQGLAKWFLRVGLNVLAARHPALFEFFQSFIAILYEEAGLCHSMVLDCGVVSQMVHFVLAFGLFDLIDLSQGW
jgi:hypothetical protein